MEANELQHRVEPSILSQVFAEAVLGWEAVSERSKGLHIARAAPSMERWGVGVWLPLWTNPSVVSFQPSLTLVVVSAGMGLVWWRLGASLRALRGVIGQRLCGEFKSTPESALEESRLCGLRPPFSKCFLDQPIFFWSLSKSRRKQHFHGRQNIVVKLRTTHSSVVYSLTPWPSSLFIASISWPVKS
jgi:hypothetical protein